MVEFTTQEPIKGFSGPYRWLSNFFPATIDVYDLTFPTVEHAYVFMKGVPAEDVALIQFMKMTPGQIKRYGRTIELVPDWDRAKFKVMQDLVTLKFSDSNLGLKQLLDETGDCLIVEENTWNDTYWGMTPEGKGENNLGKIIMKIREDNR